MFWYTWKLHFKTNLILPIDSVKINWKDPDSIGISEETIENIKAFPDK